MIESKVVSEWIAEGEARMLLRLLKQKFPPGPPAELAAVIQGNHDTEQLARWFDAAVVAQSLDEFRQALST
ncbi:MAG: transposase [Planctomycetia bacterium]|nr:transposase [Planctomycetia bacterium]